MKPTITEEKLRKLLLCLVTEFENKHHTQLNKLDTHEFFLTERMTCAKATGLNHDYQTKTKPDGTLIMVWASEYSNVVKELASRELVRFSEKTPLIFHLTRKGFSETKAEEKRRTRSLIEKFLYFCKDNSDAIKLIATILGVIGAIITVVTKCT